MFKNYVRNFPILDILVSHTVDSYYLLVRVFFILLFKQHVVGNVGTNLEVEFL